MRLLDLFCGAGGAAKGYADAGFEVVGVDKDPQPNYPYEFVQADALEVLDRLIADRGVFIRMSPWWVLRRREIAGIHASPPCQRDSGASKSWNGRPNDHPDLIGPTQERLRRTGLPYVLENVTGARHKLRSPIMLCGTMFPGLRVTRHRYFEIDGFDVPVPLHGKHPLHYTRDKRKPHYGKLDEWEAFVMVNGGGNCSKAAAADAMGIDWPMTKHDLNEAIPPAYTEHIGEFLMRHLKATDPRSEERGPDD
jgi:DNA (cytosine-5)-methyltransferase 1